MHWCSAKGTHLAADPPRSRGWLPGARPGWSAQSADSAAMLAPRPGRATHCVRCAHAVRTSAASMRTKRAARVGRRAALLATPECAPGSQPRPRGCAFTQKSDSMRNVQIPTAKGRGASGSAPLVRREAQGWRLRAQRESSTDLSRLSERSECNERSELRDAGRPTEHRRAVGAAHRPHQ
jgi:hypothetical protein